MGAGSKSGLSRELYFGVDYDPKIYVTDDGRQNVPREGFRKGRGLPFALNFARGKVLSAIL